MVPKTVNRVANFLDGLINPVCMALNTVRGVLNIPYAADQMG